MREKDGLFTVLAWLQIVADKNKEVLPPTRDSCRACMRVSTVHVQAGVADIVAMACGDGGLCYMLHTFGTS